MLFACRFWAIIPNQFSVFWLWFETCGPFCVWSICKQKWLKNIFIRTKVLPNCCPWAYYLSNRNQIHMNREHFRSSNLHFHFSFRWNYLKLNLIIKLPKFECIPCINSFHLKYCCIFFTFEITNVTCFFSFFCLFFVFSLY